MGAMFCLLVPVKRLDHAKSRLVDPPVDRGVLMRAFALDAVSAALASDAVSVVHVVSDEPGWPGAEVLPDHGRGDLNTALRHAERHVRLRHPGLGVAAMCADLPALTTRDLDAALDASLAGALGPRWFVEDADGTGTTLLAAAPGTDLDPHFGRGSAELHARSGARALRADVPTLRCDVDTAQALVAATRLGLGRHTRAVLDD